MGPAPRARSATLLAIIGARIERFGSFREATGRRTPINSGLGQGDLVQTATHEALIHMQNKDANGLGMHFGDSAPGTDAINRKAWGQLPTRSLTAWMVCI